MTWIDPTTIHNPTTGTIAPASWGDTINDDINYLSRDRPACKVYHSVDQVPSNVNNWSPIAFDAEYFDNVGMHSTTSNNTRITVPTTGLYFVSAGLGYLSYSEATIKTTQIATTWSGNTSSPQALRAMHILPTSTPSVQRYLSVAGVVRLTAGQYVELQILTDQTNSGFGSTVIYANNCFLSVVWFGI